MLSKGGASLRQKKKEEISGKKWDTKQVEVMMSNDEKMEEWLKVRKILLMVGESQVEREAEIQELRFLSLQSVMSWPSTIHGGVAQTWGLLRIGCIGQEIARHCVCLGGGIPWNLR